VENENVALAAKLTTALQRCEKYKKIVEDATPEAEKAGMFALATALATELVAAAQGLTAVTADDIVRYTRDGYVAQLHTMVPKFTAFVSDIPTPVEDGYVRAESLGMVAAALLYHEDDRRARDIALAADRTRAATAPSPASADSTQPTRVCPWCESINEARVFICRGCHSPFSVVPETLSSEAAGVEHSGPRTPPARRGAGASGVPRPRHTTAGDATLR
jgi:hypothetical protein